MFIDRSKDKEYYVYYMQGYSAYKEGKKEVDNPYEHGSIQYKYWIMGFKDAPWEDG